MERKILMNRPDQVLKQWEEQKQIQKQGVQLLKIIAEVSPPKPKPRPKAPKKKK
jgi:hypothetical protein